jgi:hypothetical protein
LKRVMGVPPYVFILQRMPYIFGRVVSNSVQRTAR